MEQVRDIYSLIISLSRKDAFDVLFYPILHVRFFCTTKYCCLNNQVFLLYLFVEIVVVAYIIWNLHRPSRQEEFYFHFLAGTEYIIALAWPRRECGFVLLSEVDKDYICFGNPDMMLQDNDLKTYLLVDYNLFDYIIF